MISDLGNFLEGKPVLYNGSSIRSEEFLSKVLMNAPEMTHNRLLAVLKNLGPRQVCQYQFKTNDIVWICKQCQKDETCVLCNECYQKSNHEGHEVFFYHSAAGGCCDCGDGEAWNPSGFCCHHGKKQADPTKFIPESMKGTAQSLISQVIDSLVRFCHQYGFHDSYSVEPESEIGYFIRLYLDDFHTAQEYQAILHSAALQLLIGDGGVEESNESVLTSRGYITVKSNFRDKQSVKQILTYFRSQSFQVRAFRREDLQQYEIMTGCLSWLHSVSLACDGFCSMIGQALPVNKLEQIFEYDMTFDKQLSKMFHNLLLSLMADQSMKMTAAIAYTHAFQKMCHDFAHLGQGLNGNTMFNLSVQYLNREVFVHEITYHHGYFEESIVALEDILCSGSNSASNGAKSNSSNTGRSNALGGALSSSALIRPGPISRGSSDTSASNMAVNGSTFTSILTTPTGILDHDAYLKMPSIVRRRYYPIIGDYKIVLTVPDISRLFLSTNLNSWLRILAYLQGLHPQERMRFQHVLFEDKGWMHAFSLCVGLFSLFDYFTNWFGDEEKVVQSLRQESTSGQIANAHTFTGSSSTSSASMYQHHPKGNVKYNPTVSVNMISVYDYLVQCFDSMIAWQQKQETIWMIASASQEADMNSLLMHNLKPQWFVFSPEWFEEYLHRQAEFSMESLIPMLYLGMRHPTHLIDEWLQQNLDPLEFGEFPSPCLSLPQRNYDKRSFHFPLHSFFAHVLQDSSRFPHLTDTLGKFLGYISSTGRVTNGGIYAMYQIAIQPLIFAKEVRQGMWRRNGNPMIDQILNFSEPPFTRYYQDLDIFLCQLSALFLPIPLMIMTLLQEASCLSYLYPEYTNHVGVTFTAEEQRLELLDSEHAMGMIGFVIQLVLQWVTELPVPPANSLEDRLAPLIRKTWIHRLCCASLPYSQLQESIGHFPDILKLPSDYFDKILFSIATKSTSLTSASVSAAAGYSASSAFHVHLSSGGNTLIPPSYTLKKEYWASYDPSFSHLSESMHQQAQDRRPVLHVLNPIASRLPPCHEQFLIVRDRFLFDLTIWKIWKRLMIGYLFPKCVADAKFAEKYTSISSLLTLLRSCPPDRMTKSVYWHLKTTDTIMSKLIHYLTLAMHELVASITTPLSSTSAAQDAFVHYLCEEDEENGMNLPSLLHLLVDLQKYFASLGDASNHPYATFQQLSSATAGPTPASTTNQTKYPVEYYYFSWILQQIARLSQSNASLYSNLSNLLPSPTVIEEQNTAEEVSLAQKDKLKQESQQRALQSIQNAAKSFLAMMDDLSDSEEEDEDGDEDNEDERKRRCDEDNRVDDMEEDRGDTPSSVIQMLANATTSTSSSNAPTATSSPVKNSLRPLTNTIVDGTFDENALFFRRDEEIEDKDDEGSQEEDELCIICQQDLTGSGEEGNFLGFLSLIQPSVVTHPVKEAPSTAPQDCGNDYGYYCAETLNKPDSVHLQKPSYSSCSLRLGSCGHVMHLGCHNIYVTDQSKKSRERNHLILDMSDGFFLCPLCKKLGNCLLPKLSIVQEDSSSVTHLQKQKMNSRWNVSDTLAAFQADGNSSDENDPSEKDSPASSGTSTDARQTLVRLIMSPSSSPASSSSDRAAIALHAHNLLGKLLVPNLYILDKCLGQKFNTIAHHSLLDISTLQKAVSSNSTSVNMMMRMMHLPHHLCFLEIYLHMLAYTVSHDLVAHATWHHAIPGYHLSSIQSIYTTYHQAKVSRKRSLDALRQRMTGEDDTDEDGLWEDNTIKYSPGQDDLKSFNHFWCLLIVAFRSLPNSSMKWLEHFITLLFPSSNNASVPPPVSSSADEVYDKIISTMISQQSSTQSSSQENAASSSTASSQLNEDELQIVRQRVSLQWLTSSPSSSTTKTPDGIDQQHRALLHLPLFDVVLSILAVYDTLPYVSNAPSAEILSSPPGKKEAVTDEAGHHRILHFVALLVIARFVQLFQSSPSPCSMMSEDVLSLPDIVRSYPTIGWMVETIVIAMNPQSVSSWSIGKSVWEHILKEWLWFMRAIVHAVCRISSLLPTTTPPATTTASTNGSPTKPHQHRRYHPLKQRYVRALRHTCTRSAATPSHWLFDTAPSDDESKETMIITDGMIRLWLYVMGWDDLLQDSVRDVTQSALSKQIHNWLTAASLVPANIVNMAQHPHFAYYPHSSIPQLISLPKDYSRLHAIVMASCSFEYPALCLRCGAIVNASGMGQCLAHSYECNAGIGVYFLLQDCNVLLCHGPRCAYFPSPYVDIYGEIHQSNRGKPLHLDAIRYEALRGLYASHSIPTLITQKRSADGRIIINGYY